MQLLGGQRLGRLAGTLPGRQVSHPAHHQEAWQVPSALDTAQCPGIGFGPYSRCRGRRAAFSGVRAGKSCLRPRKQVTPHPALGPMPRQPEPGATQRIQGPLLTKGRKPDKGAQRLVRAAQGPGGSTPTQGPPRTGARASLCTSPAQGIHLSLEEGEYVALGSTWGDLEHRGGDTGWRGPGHPRIWRAHPEPEDLRTVTGTQSASHRRTDQGAKNMGPALSQELLCPQGSRSLLGGGGPA